MVGQRHTSHRPGRGAGRRFEVVVLTTMADISDRQGRAEARTPGYKWA
jgi:hypothetical protein